MTAEGHTIRQLHIIQTNFLLHDHGISASNTAYVVYIVDIIVCKQAFLFLKLLPCNICKC